MKKLMTILSILLLAIVLSLGSGIVQTGALAGPNSPEISVEKGATLLSSMPAAFVSQGIWHPLKATSIGVSQDVINCGDACGIDIRKQAEGPDSRDFASGSDVPYEIVVTNTGTFDLTDVTVTDDQVPGCANFIGDLAAGASVTYSCTAPAVTEGFTNTACVEGIIQNATFSDCDPSTVRIADIDIRKQAEGEDSRDIVSGSDVTYEIVVTNTGEVDLTGVEVTDAEAPGCANTIGDLAAGASVTYNCTVPAVTEGFTNTACVAGSFEAGEVSDCDSSTVKVADIDIRKQAEGDDSRDIVSGSDVTYEIVVTNTGEVDLTDVEVTDADAPGCANSIGDLAAGASVTYSCTVPAVTEGFTNTACVEGLFGEESVDDCDSSTVKVADIDIRKQAEGPDSRVFPAGSDVTYEIVVTNTGEVDLTDVEVTDAEAPGCANSIGDLAAGASVTYSCTVPAVEEGFTNTACVEGLFGAESVDDCDSSEVKVADIFVRKQAKGQDYRTFGVSLDPPNEVAVEVSFEIEVINTGEVALTDVMVSDEQLPACEREIDSLAVDASVTYTCTVSFTFTTVDDVGAGAMRNIVVATGHFDGGMVDDDDPSSVDFEAINCGGCELHKLFMPAASNAPVAVEYTMGYEDWEAPFLDYDYNDWVTDVRTELFYVGPDQISKLIFYFVPEARGGVFKTAFHMDFDASFLTSSGMAEITIYDENGEVVTTESYSQPVVANSPNRFTIFDDTYIVFPPPGVVVNAIENTPFQPAQRTAKFTLTLDEPITLPRDQLTFAFVGPHGSGLFFDPHLNILDPRVDISGGQDYEIGKGDVRTLVIPTTAYKWPEEHVLVTYA
ncbi:MAG: hypothetical protein ACK2UW_24100, partial [Anaerolineales bacterium]